MYVHTEKKLIFLANPRTGSQAVAKALLDRGFGQQGTHHYGCKLPAADWTTFTTVRNHFDASLSWFYSQRPKDPLTALNLELALASNNWVTLKRMFMFREADITMRYESLHNDLNLVMMHFDLPLLADFLVVNKTTARPDGEVGEIHTTETWNYIWDRFKYEISHYYGNDRSYWHA